MVRRWLSWGSLGVVACSWGCSGAADSDGALAELSSPLVSSCTADVECGAGFACTTGGTCVRPSNCYSGATGPGVLVGSLLVDGTDTQGDIAALGGAWCVTGNITVKNTALVDAAGFSSLLAVAGTISFEDNPSLTSLTGLQNLRRIYKLALFRNASLTSLSALSRVDTLSSLQVYINPGLTDLSGLESVKLISNAEVVNNAGLTSLRGLGSLSRVFSYVDVRFNPRLSDLTGLDSLASIGNLLQVTDNSGLVSLHGVGSLTNIDSTLRIWRNPQLKSLSALTSLTRTPTFQVADNPVLDSCNVAAIAAQAAANCSGCTNNGPCPPPDLCPSDPQKLEPGICGCGVSDRDSDGDGSADCVDACPLDATGDSDGDGICDSLDRCPGSDDAVDVDGNGTPDGCQDCVFAADCDDGNACTADACNSGVCENPALVGAACGQHGACSEAAECLEPACRFVPVGFTPQGTGSLALAISHDGLTVAGTASNGGDARGFRWTESGGMKTLPWDYLDATTVSADGAKVAGAISGGFSFRELGGGAFAYSDQNAPIFDGSADGRVLVGRWGSMAMRWVEGSAPEWIAPNGAHGRSLGSPLFQNTSYASGVSADGSVIVGGGGLPAHGGFQEAFIWREGVATVGLGTLSTAAGSTSSATAVSPDGLAVVGTSSEPGGSPTSGFRWTAATGMQSLGAFTPEAVSNSGVMVGRGGNGRAAVMGSSLGDGDLATLLQGCGINLPDWILSQAADITPDGKTLVGWGYNSTTGKKQGFVVYLR